MKTTHINQQRYRYSSNRDQVQELLGIDDLEYCTMVYEFGLYFLHQEFPVSDSAFEPAFRMHERESFYWKWFMNEYAILEEQLLRGMYNSIEAGYNFNRRLSWIYSVHYILSQNNVRLGFNNYIKILTKNGKKRNQRELV